ncbi:MAG: methionine--tRNA ligase subunit beta [Candidatus Roizmanbacteria bacterium]|nr:methionine--tRNA ligase subunit beta [Candidatus Roizmanbacteria bacterium]
MITFDDFKKLDIRIGTIKSAEKVENADKLLKLIFDLGTEERQVISGIAEFFADPKTLVGKQVAVLVNIEPRTIRGEESFGMILAMGESDTFSLLVPEKPVVPGSAVR